MYRRQYSEDIFATEMPTKDKQQTDEEEVAETAAKLAKMSVRADSGIGSLERSNSEMAAEEKGDEFADEMEVADSKEGLPKIESMNVRQMHEQIGRLTAEQRLSCKRNFAEVEKHTIRFGMTVMLRLFSDHPQHKDIWPQFREIPDSSLMNAAALRKHASVYMGGLRKIITSMDDDVELERSLRRIAHAHVERNIHKRHLMNMLPCVLEAFEEYCSLDEKSRQAWTTLFDVIANLIDIFRVSL